MIRTWLLIFFLVVGFFSSGQDSLRTENFIIVNENLPEYPGGIKQYFKELSDEIVYPKLALKKRIEGHVFVEIIVW